MEKIIHNKSAHAYIIGEETALRRKYRVFFRHTGLQYKVCNVVEILRLLQKYKEVEVYSYNEYSFGWTQAEVVRLGNVISVVDGDTGANMFRAVSV